MAQLNQTFNINDLPQGGGYELLPDGWYTAKITKAELLSTKDGLGQYIKVRYDIIGPTHQGRVVFNNLNIRNPSASAEDIARKSLGDIMRAIGLTMVSDSDQLVGGTLQIKVATKPGDGKYEAQNEIKGFRANGGSPAPMVTQAAAPAASTPPWMK